MQDAAGLSNRGRARRCDGARRLRGCVPLLRGIALAMTGLALTPRAYAAGPSPERAGASAEGRNASDATRRAQRLLLERAKQRFEAGRGDGAEARDHLEGALDALNLAYGLAPEPSCFPRASRVDVLQALRSE